MIDGASTDSTLDIVKRYDEVQWISEPDRGQSDAINKGFLRATGDLVGWLNADDYYLPGGLEAIARAAQEHPEADIILRRLRLRRQRRKNRSLQSRTRFRSLRPDVLWLLYPIHFDVLSPPHYRLRLAAGLRLSGVHGLRILRPAGARWLQLLLCAALHRSVSLAWQQRKPQAAGPARRGAATGAVQVWRRPLIRNRLSTSRERAPRQTRSAQGASAETSRASFALRQMLGRDTRLAGGPRRLANMQNLSVLVIHNRYQQPGGEDAVVHAEVDLLRSAGHRVLQYTRDNAVSPATARCTRLPCSSAPPGTERTYADIRALIVKQRPDIAHCHNLLAAGESRLPITRASRQACPSCRRLHNYRLFCPAGTCFRMGGVAKHVRKAPSTQFAGDATGIRDCKPRRCR